MQRVKLTYNDIAAAVDSFSLPTELITIPWYAIARGSLPFATMLAVKYGRRFGVVDPRVGWAAPSVQRHNRALLIDDVMGTGVSIINSSQLLLQQNIDLTLNYLFLIDSPDSLLPNRTSILPGDVYYELPWEPEHNALLDSLAEFKVKSHP